MKFAIAALLASSALDNYERASRFFERQQFAEAGQALDAALNENPDLVPALTLKGKLAMAVNRFEVARPAFERAARLEPRSAYTQFLLGFVYYVDNDFAKAMAPLETALRLQPDNARTELYLGLTLDGLAKPLDAVGHYRRSLALKPEPDTHVAFGRLLFSLGNFEESGLQIDAALALNPQSRDGHYERGRLFFEAGKFTEAAGQGELASHSPGIGTTDRQIHFLLARAYRKLGQTELAMRHRLAFESTGASLRR